MLCVVGGGEAVGACVGFCVGARVGASVGARVGCVVGLPVGDPVGAPLGFGEGVADGGVPPPPPGFGTGGVEPPPPPPPHAPSVKASATIAIRKMRVEVADSTVSLACVRTIPPAMNLQHGRLVPDARDFRSEASLSWQLMRRGVY